MELEKLKALADTFMDRAKQNLIEDGALTPIVVQICGETLTIIGIAEMPTPRAKQAIYASISKLLRKNKAEAAILVNDAYAKKLPIEKSKAFVETYQQGDLSRDFDATEGIIVSIMGRDFEAITRTLFYARGPTGDIEFGEEQTWTEVQVYMLPIWWAFDMDTVPPAFTEGIRRLKKEGMPSEQFIRVVSIAFKKYSDANVPLPTTAELLDWYEKL